MLVTYVALRLQGHLPAESVPPRRGAGSAGLRDGGLVHDEHQLAVVRRRDGDELPLADDAARLPQLRFRGRRGRRRGGAGAGHRAPLGGAHRQLLGGPGARHAVPVPPALLRAGAAVRPAGRDPEPPSLRHRHHARGRQAGPGHGSGGEPGGHQAARHQRRRLLQRQRGASVREPDAVDELPLDARDLPRARRPHLHLRPDGEEPGATAGRCGRRCSCCSARA